MDQKSNPLQDPEPSPQFTLFGKRMDMGKRAAEAPMSLGSQPGARPGFEDAEERRTFWLVVGIFAVAFGAALLSVHFFRPKAKVPSAPAAQPRAQTQTAQPRLAEPPATARPVPRPPPETTMAQPAAQPPTAQPPSAPAAEPRPGETKAEVRPSPRRAAQAGGRPAAHRAARASRSPARRLPPDPYIQRLREEMERYEREKAQGKYREFPR